MVFCPSLVVAHTMRVRRLAGNARRQPNVASSGALVNQAKIPIQPDKEANNWSGPVVRFFVWYLKRLQQALQLLRCIHGSLAGKILADIGGGFTDFERAVSQQRDRLSSLSIFRSRTGQDAIGQKVAVD